MKLSKKISFIVLAFVILNSSLSQEIYFDTYGHESGITQASGLDFSQDKQGFIWVATFDGVNRFDGRIFKNFNHVPGDSTSLLNSNVSNILSDHSGYTWVLTTAGLCRYNPNLGQFERSPIGINLQNKYMLYEDAQNSFWIFHKKGFHIFNDNGTIDKLELPADISVNSVFQINYDLFLLATNKGVYQYKRSIEELRISYLKDTAVNSVIKDPNETLWFATSDGLFKINLNNNIITTPALNGPINELLISSTNDLWIVGDSIYHKKFNSDIIVNINLNAQSLADVSNTYLAIFEDHSGGIWIGTDGFGIKHFNPNKLNFQTLSFNAHTKNSLSSPFVSSIFEDINYTWIGTSNGLSRFNFQDGSVKNYGQKDGISATSIKSLIKWNNKLFIGTSRGLFIKKNELFAPIFPELSHHIIECLYSFRDTLWVGTDQGLWNISKKKNGSFHINDTNFETGITSLLIDSAKAILWAGTSEGILKIVNNKVIEQFVHNEGSPSSLPNDFIKSLAFDRKNNLWIGTKGGLCLYNEQKNNFNNFFKKNGLPNDVIYGILVDRNNYLWLSTNSGLCKFHPDSLSFKLFDKNDNLQGYEFNTGAYHRGNSGYFYFGGINGLSFFKPQDLNITTSPPITIVTDIFVDRKPLIVSKNGLLTSHPSVVDSLKLNYSNNDIIFGFTGLSFEDPRRIKYRYQLVNFNEEWIESDLPSAEFTNLSPGNYKFIVSSTNRYSDWSTPSNPISIIITPPLWGILWVQIATTLLIFLILFFVYQWRIQALKKQKSKLKRLVQERTDEITAQNEELHAQSEAIELQNNELAEQKEELHALNTQLEKIVDSRTIELTATNKRLLTALEELDTFVYRSSHDLRGPISTLLGLIQITKMELKEQSSINLVEKIGETVDRLETTLAKLLTINVINKTIKIKTDVFIKQFVQQIINEISEPQDITISNNISDELVIDTDIVLMQIIFEHLLSNSITFRSHNPIEINIECFNLNNKTVVSITDNGMGIHKHIQSKVFNMFFRGSEISKGNGLGLYIVKKIVEKLNGKIELIPQETGTKFTFTLESMKSN